MLKLVSIYNNMYAVYDDSDDVTDVITESEVRLLLNIGLSIDGVSRVDDNNFNVSSDVQKLTSLDVMSEDEAFDDEYDDGYDDSEDEDDMSYDDYSDEDIDEDCYEDTEDTEEDEYDEYDDYDDMSYDDGYEDEEDSMLEESIVNKLYSILTTEQLNALRKYYLWYSRRLFSEATHDQTFGMKDKKRMLSKKQALDGLKAKNQNAIWKYAGFIDMGRKGNGFCELGHPLRYMHIAWDTSVQDIETAFFGEDYEGRFDEAIESENSIVFGIKCIADFFEVDKEVVGQLQAAQRESLKDMAIIYDFHEKGLSADVINSFTVLDDFMNLYRMSWLKAQMAGIVTNNDFSKALMSFYLEFRKLNMVPPKSMIQEIRDSLIGWKSHKYSGYIKYPETEVLVKNLELTYSTSVKQLVDLLCDSILNKGYARNGKPYGFGFEDGLYCYFTNYFVYKICGAYEWGRPKYDLALTGYSVSKLDKNAIWSDEGGWSDKIRNYKYNLDYVMKNRFFKEPEYSSDYIRKLVECISLATKYQYRGTEFHTFSCIENDGLFELSDVKSFNISYYKTYSDENRSSLLDNVKKLDRCNDLYFSFGDFRSRVTLDEKIEELKVMISCIEEELPKFHEWFDTYIRNYIDNKNKPILEERARIEEQRLVKEVSEEVVEEVATDNESNNTTVPEVSKEDVLEYLKTADISSLEKDSKFAFQLKVFDSFKKYGKASDKQYIYLKDIYDALHGKTNIQTDHRPSKVLLENRQDLKVALEWYVSQTSGIDAKTKDICNSILKYGSISDRQMRYADKAKQLYDSSNK